MFDYDLLPFDPYLDNRRPASREFVARERPRLSEELLRQVSAAHEQAPVDLLFTYLYAAHVEPGAIRDIGRMGIATVNWFCNASYQLDLVAPIAPAYDWCLVPERFRLDDYRRLGATPLYCQEAANPNVYRPLDVPQEHDVTFVGQRYGDRPAFLRALLDAGVDVRAFGPVWLDPPAHLPGWRRLAGRAKRRALRQPEPVLATFPPERCGPPLSDADYVAMYSRSRISLGFSKVADGLPGTTSIRQVRLRDFEATMSGAFYLVERCEELEDFFEPDREIVTFEGVDELVEKARHYLAHEAERERIRVAGLRRARAEHTWQARLSQAFREMGLEPAG